MFYISELYNFNQVQIVEGTFSEIALVVIRNTETDFCRQSTNAYEVKNKNQLIAGVGTEYLRAFDKYEVRLLSMMEFIGVVCQSMHYYMQLNNLFDIILSGELDLQDVSSMYSRIDDRITVIYSGYMHKGYRYKYEYKVTDLDKFQLLLTKISIRYSKFF